MLSNRQALFVAEYSVDRNAIRAAIRAGYSRRGADVQGHRLLKNPEVARAVEEAISEQSARIGVTADWVLQRLFNIAGGDPNELIHHRRIACGG
jgi:phage terminase small subunit